MHRVSVSAGSGQSVSEWSVKKAEESRAEEQRLSGGADADAASSPANNNDIKMSVDQKLKIRK